MQLTIEYREKKTSYDHKDFYLICKVVFSHEELAVAQERGMWDTHIDVMPSGAPIGSGSQFANTAMKVVGGGCLLPLSLMFGCMAAIAPSVGRTDYPPVWLTLILMAAGISLVVWAFLRNREGEERVSIQSLTIGRLANDGTFQIHADTLQLAKAIEIQVREELTTLANALRRSTVIPEQNTYDL